MDLREKLTTFEHVDNAGVSRRFDYAEPVSRLRIEGARLALEALPCRYFRVEPGLDCRFYGAVRPCDRCAALASLSTEGGR